MKNSIKFLVVFCITFALAACHPPPRPPEPPKPPHPRHGSLENKTEKTPDLLNKKVIINSSKDQV
ncbi:hypothetical protein [Chryseobacterium oryzae]|uniref:Lipoprotein n=1 Tax=Chryseobacterium oryzae TaxID=2929799 RepID=A0ABY4BNT2_9FLAO|nr:hypothetical protein [Chryseobacterium oryzae]UOE39373.1 hypothetical protein MTP08_06255 [Chryseobacterium oryzae]